MEVRIHPGKGKQTEAHARFHRVICDQPFDDGGMDAGMTPAELLLAALGCSAMHSAAAYLRAQGLATDKIDLTVSAERGGRPLRVTEIGIELDVPGLTTHLREGLIQAVEASSLCRTLQNPPALHIRMATELVEAPLNHVGHSGQHSGLAS